ncbi:MAG: polysaccharide biosynthesis C-terminal domain-containing protein [Candidatus Omnitrophica bacterium]|nr:polysaccharide biosynthesis C-terminal domain-containing protein [Candidatus Omnitrophota bacterium]
MINYNKSFVKNNIYVITSQILIYAQGVILIPLLIKTIGVAVYGGYILLNTGIDFLFGISSLGVGFTFKRYLPSENDRRKQRELFYPQFIFHFLLILLLSLCLLISADFIKAWFLKNCISFSMPLVCCVLIATFFFRQATDFFRYSHRMGLFSIGTIACPYLAIFLIIIVYSIGHLHINSLLKTEITALLCISIPLCIKIYSEVGFRIPAIQIKEIVNNIRLGFPIVLAFSVGYITAVSDKYIIAFFMAPLYVGYYSPAFTFGSIIMLLPRALSMTLFPLLATATDKQNIDGAKRLVMYSVKTFLIFVIPFIIGSSILARDVLILFANQEVADAAFLCVPIVACGSLFYGLSMLFTTILYTHLKTKNFFFITAVSAALNVVLNIIFIYLFKHIIIAALTTLLSYFVCFVLLNREVKMYLEIYYDKAVILKCVGASLLMGLCVCGAKYFCSNIFLLVAVGCLSYFMFLMISGAVSRSEIRYVKNFIYGRLNT